MKCKAILFLLAVCSLVQSQNDPNAARDAKLIADAKAVPVQKLDSGLPLESFEKWLRDQSGSDAKYHWEVNDCGEQSGAPGDSGPIPLCVEVDVSLKDGREIVIFIADDSPPAARDSDWKIFFAQVTTQHEKINIRRLSDLPAVLTKTR
jgi:hypothetical protein